MLERIEVRHYKSLRRVSVELESFNILVGPNSSGKSNFLDVLLFLRDALTMSEGFHSAILKRGRTIQEIIWKGKGDAFEIGIEARIPDEIVEYLKGKTGRSYRFLRYQVRIVSGEEGIGPNREELYLVSESAREEYLRSRLFDFPSLMEDTPILPEPGAEVRPATGYRLVARRKEYGSRVHVKSETSKFNVNFDIDPKRSLLSVILEDKARFNASLWFKNLLEENVVFMHLNTEAMRKPIPPDTPGRFHPDGSNLAKVVYLLKKDHPERFRWWVDHVKEFLSDIENVDVKKLTENNFIYLNVKYRYSLDIPSWLLSDGTLRFLALSVIPYLPRRERVFMIEEPENGLHPLAIEGVFQSLKGGYTSGNQILVATHSPVFLAMAELRDLLIFGKTDIGSTDIIRGNVHPKLKDWKKKVSMESLIAGGVL